MAVPATAGADMADPGIVTKDLCPCPLPAGCLKVDEIDKPASACLNVEDEDAPRVAVIVLNWNGRVDTLGCLRSLRALKYPAADVIVADNGSNDGSVPAIRESFPDVAILENGANLGYAGGNNQAIRFALEAGAELVWLLNNDTVVEPDALTALVEALKENPTAGALASKVLLASDQRRVWYAGATRDGIEFRHEGLGQLDVALTEDQLRDTDYGCGCSLLMTRAALQRVGSFDERFFLCFEDSDWSYRVRNAGFRVLYVPRSRVIHRGSASFGGSESPLFAYFMFRNRFLWWEIHLPKPERRQMTRQAYWQFRADFRNDVRSRGWRAALSDRRRIAMLLGLRDYLLRRFGDCPPGVRRLAVKREAHEPAN